MTREPLDPAYIAARTLADYDTNAAAFEDGTRDHDVRQNIDALLRGLPRPGPARILDFGCGPGRDVATFRALGHDVVGLDGSTAFVERARATTGAPVWHQDFFALDLPRARFDGVFANATLQHVPGAWLPTVLGRLHATLDVDGVLFASIPRALDGEPDGEGWNRERYSRYHGVDGWRRFVAAAGFVELEHFYRPPGLPRDAQRWFASVWRRVAQPG